MELQTRPVISCCRFNRGLALARRHSLPTWLPISLNQSLYGAQALATPLSIVSTLAIVRAETGKLGGFQPEASLTPDMSHQF